MGTHTIHPLVSLPTLLLPPRPSGWPRILMYHRVTASEEPSGMNCPPHVFTQHLAILRTRNVRFCTLSELERRAGNDEKNLVAITFDDGFTDNYEEMFPLLEAADAKATIFYATRYKEIEQFGPAATRDMVESGRVEIGSHTMHHLNLTTLTPAEAQREIEGSKHDVEDLTGQPCTCFAYPFGRYNIEHREILSRAGYRLAVTTKKQVLPWRHTDPLQIPRLSINGAAAENQFRRMLSRGRFRF